MVVPTRLQLTPSSSYLSPFSKYLLNFSYLEPAQFKVIQGQCSKQCQSQVHWWFPVWPPLSPTLCIPPYSRYLMLKSCDLDVERFKVIERSKVKGHGANRETIGGCLYDFNWHHHRTWHCFRSIWCAILVTLNKDSSRSSKVNVHSANRKSIGRFLSDIHCVQPCSCHRIPDS